MAIFHEDFAPGPGPQWHELGLSGDVFFWEFPGRDLELLPKKWRKNHRSYAR